MAELKNPKDILPTRDPRDAVDNFMTIYDENGNAHRRPRIVAKEILRGGDWTKDAKVAVARREAASKPASKPTSSKKSTAKTSSSSSSASKDDDGKGSKASSKKDDDSKGSSKE